MTSRIILHGMHRSPNFGDVLLTQILQDHLDRLPEMEIRLLAPLENVRALLEKPRANTKDFLTADAVILGGGGFFQRMDGASGSLKALIKYAFPLFAARMLGKPTAIIGSGADRMPRGWLDSVFALFVGGADQIAVRDQQSYDYLQSITSRSIDRPIHRVSDLVFAIDRDWLQPADIAWAESVIDELGGERVLAIHLSEPPSLNHSYDEVTRILEELLADQLDTAILLLEDHPSGPNQQAAAMAELQKRLPNRRMKALPYESVGKLAAVLAAIDGVLTSKLHVALCAATMGTPPFAIAKHRKNAASFSDLGIADQCCSLQDGDADAMRNIVRKFVSTRGRFEVPAEVRDRAHLALSIADSFVRRSASRA